MFNCVDAQETTTKQKMQNTHVPLRDILRAINISKYQ